MADPQAAAGPLVSGIPLALWVTIAVAVVSPLVTIGGIWRSNANARRLQRAQFLKDAQDAHDEREQRAAQFGKQLAHDTGLRDRDREMSMRREVFLEAAAALVQVQTLVAQAINLEVPAASLGVTLGEKQAAIAKVHIVGSKDTVAAVMRYSRAVGSAFIDLISRRPPLEIRRSKIQTHLDLMKRHLEVADRFTRMIEQYSLDGINDPKKLTSIQRQHQGSMELFEEQRQLHDQLQAEQLAAIVTLADRSVELNKHLISLLPDAVLAVRDELEFPLDRSWYKGEWQQHIETMERTWLDARRRMESPRA